MCVLDVACGPGYLTQAALERGARALGLDFSDNMVRDGGRRFPGAEFRQGDAEALPFAEGEWDAVLCSFGILHFANPDRAIAEAHRVLVPGGVYAFSAWLPVKADSFFGLIAGAIKAHGNPNVPVPPGPPMFRFGDAEECERVLRLAGFESVSIRQHRALARFPRPEQMLDMIARGTVRTKEVLRLQTPEHRARIERAIVDSAASFSKNGQIEIPAPFLIAAGRKAR
jgi:SAM-dependent methyltransferase